MFIQLNSNKDQKILYAQAERMDLCNFVTRGTQNGGITAPPTLCTRSSPIGECCRVSWYTMQTSDYSKARIKSLLTWTSRRRS